MKLQTLLMVFFLVKWFCPQCIQLQTKAVNEETAQVDLSCYAKGILKNLKQ